MAHPDGEEATARAAAKAGVCMGVSTFATTTLENIKRAGDGARAAYNMEQYAGAYMLQLYVFKNRRITEKLVKRAEKAGYKALLLTCDTPRLGNRYSHTRNNFQLPPHLKTANFKGEKVGPLVQNVVGGDDAEKSDKDAGNENGMRFFPFR